MRTRLIILLITALVLPMILFGVLYTIKLEQASEQITTRNLEERARQHSTAITRQLLRSWFEVEYLAATIQLEKRERLRETLTDFAKTNPKFLWLGVAFTNGEIYAASSGRKERETVRGEEWFESGLLGDFAVDYRHGSGVPATERANSAALVNFAAPIQNAEGKNVGVLGARFDWTEVRELVRALSDSNSATLLLNRDRKVLFGPEGMEGEMLPQRIQLSGRSMETWPDGKLYVTVSRPAIVHGDLPTFGWRLVVREDAAYALQPFRQLTQQFWLALAIGVALMSFMMIVLSHKVAASVRRLAKFATSLAEGDFSEYPPEEQSYRETAQLSSALARIQSQLTPVRNGPRPVIAAGYAE